MLNLHAEDKSFSSFLSNKNNMPDRMRQFFEEEYRIFSSPSFYEILALWKKTTKPYLNEQPTTTALQKNEQAPDFIKPVFTPEEEEKLIALAERRKNQEYK